MKLRRIADQGGAAIGYLHWCPGCKGPHGIAVEQPNRTGAKWTFDGNFEAPTFGPSILCYTSPGKWEGDKWVETGPRTTTCHYFIRAGQIDFCSDSLHELAGKTVPLPDYPEPKETELVHPPKRRRRPARARSARSRKRRGS